MPDASADVMRLTAALAAANAKIKQLQGQHKGLVALNAIYRERPDLPVDRLPAYRRLMRRITVAEARVAELERVLQTAGLSFRAATEGDRDAEGVRSV